MLNIKESNLNEFSELIIIKQYFVIFFNYYVYTKIYYLNIEYVVNMLLFNFITLVKILSSLIPLYYNS